ncbi:phosphatase PAP2 family protein [Dysgonomonas sp. OttesenSCG-928-M03]|nr:phosphatase PAP2 family protein [Dysgonomonas sp. OttesenSCG-928-M03]
MIQSDANELVENILPYEREVFLWLNNSHNIFWDSFMWIYSNKYTWIPLAVVAIGVFTYKTKWRYSVLFILCVALLFTLCDQLSANVIKPIFERYRPTHHPDFSDCVRVVNNYRGGRYGFISAHAANGFGAAMFLSMVFKYRKLTILFFLWASITAYSRIYLGVHFISDVVGGLFLGLLVGYVVYLLLQYCRVRILKQTPEEVSHPLYTVLRANILCATIVVIVVTIFIISLMNFIYGFRWLY